LQELSFMLQFELDPTRPALDLNLIAIDPPYDKVHVLPEAPSNLAALCNGIADEHTLSMCRKKCAPVECSAG
jgi:hypothetical protein